MKNARKFFNISLGFTLIELLVVVAIIGLLSSVVMASLNSARMKARDATRMSDMREIQKAIELYFSNTGHYPNSPGTGDVWAGCWQKPNNWIPDGEPRNYDWSTGYLPKQPHDPADICCWPWGNSDGICGQQVGGNPGTYEYWSNGNQYFLAARLENISSPYRAEVTGVIDPRSGQPYANNGPLAKYVFVITN